MLNKWKILISDAQFNNLVKKALIILDKSDTIVFTYQSTGSNWLGVQTATKAMFPDNFLILPQSYSNSLLSETQRKKFTKILIKNKLNLIIFSGVPDYSFNWLREFHNLKIKTGIIFHGGLSELNGNPEKQKNFQKIVLFSKNGIINRIGVVKEGLDYWFESVTQSKIYRVQ